MNETIAISVFLDACKVNDTTTVKRYLAQSSNVNMAVDRRRTPLHLAVASSDCDTALLQNRENVPMLLIQANADLEAKDSGERTPLYRAAESHCAGSLLLLLQSYADTTAVEYHGYTALHIAAHTGFLEGVKLLLRFHAEIEAVDNSQETPLLLALAGDQMRENSHQQIEIVKLLLQARANVQAQEERGYTALHLAVRYDNLELVTLLLNYQCDIKARENKGNTPLHLAAQDNAKSVLPLLLQYEDNIEVKNDLGNTPLHVAVRGFPRIEIIQQLLEAGADLYALNQEGLTPLAIVEAYDEDKDWTNKMLAWYSSEIATVNRRNRQRQQAAQHVLALLRWFLRPSVSPSAPSFSILPVEIQLYLLSFVMQGCRYLTQTDYQTIQRYAEDRATLGQNKQHYFQTLWGKSSFFPLVTTNYHDTHQLPETGQSPNTPNQVNLYDGLKVSRRKY